MALASGTRLGAYEIVGLLGKGGMGEVYRARDTSLNRDVAIKVLPDLFADDPERRARFDREAQLLASLNHPNIAAIYGLAEGPAEPGQAGIRGLAMELVEGPTLADILAHGLGRLGRSPAQSVAKTVASPVPDDDDVENRERASSVKGVPLPVDEALTISRQVADALEAAHAKGVIHRDLKPANIKLTPDGAVKVLDFGLAKALGDDGQAADPALSPTLTAGPTRVGMILGTAAYMSPEQAKGRTTDRRTDVWAFGCVLFEMLTGRRPFDGEDVSDTLAAVLRAEPDWTLLPADVPAPVRNVLKRCLEKERRKRIPDMSVAQFLMNEPPVAAPVVATAPVLAPGSVRKPVAIAATIALVAGAAVATLATWWVTRPAPPLPVRFGIVPAPAQALLMQNTDRDIAITPNGRHIVYRAGQGLDAHLAVRPLDQLDARLLAGTSPARAPFVSPDGQWIGYFTTGGGGDLKKVSITGGPSVTLCTYPAFPRGASWGPNGAIIFASGDQTTGLFSVPEGGGEPKVLTRPDMTKGELDHLFPSFLPGGDAVLFTIAVSGQPMENAQVAVLDLKTGQKKTLIRGGSHAEYVQTGHLVYAASGCSAP